MLICTSVKQADGWDRPYTIVNYLEDAQRDYLNAMGDIGARMRVEIVRALRKRNAAQNTLAAQDAAQ